MRALAGVAAGRWTVDDLASLRQTALRCEPQADVRELVAGWRDAVGRAL